MAELTKFRINGADYDLKDETARQNSGGNVDLSITGASVGQTVRIAEVDENGVPTAWLPTDFPSGGEAKEWEEFMRFTVDNSETMVLDFSSNGTETLESKKVKEFYLYAPNYAGNVDINASVMVNNRVNIQGFESFLRARDGKLKLWISANDKSLDVLYFGRDTNAELTTSGGGAMPYVPVTESNGVLTSSTGGKNFSARITTYKDGIPFPSSPVDYIKSVVFTLTAAHSSGAEFIVYVR